MFLTFILSLFLINITPTISDYSCVDEISSHPVRNEFMLQIVLKSYNYYEGKIDGDIGPNSKTALKAFQSNNDLVVDGILGPNTCLHLLNRNNIVSNTSEKNDTGISINNVNKQY